MSNNLRTRNGMPFNFVNGLKVRGMDIESLIPGIEGIPEAGTKYQFAGNGVNTIFTLPVTPYNKDAIEVHVKQLYVHSSDYTLVGDVVTLNEAPPALDAGETHNVEIKVTLTTLNGYVDANRVSFEGENLDDILEKSKPFSNYAQLRTYSGNATQVRITDPGIAGFFYLDGVTTTTTEDNGGIVICAPSVGAKRWKRVFEGAVNVRWFGAKGLVTESAHIAIQKAIDYCVINKKNLYLPNGIYLCANTQLKITGPIEMVGESENGVIFKTVKADLSNPDGTGVGYAHLFRVTNHLEYGDIVFRNMTMDGGNSNMSKTFRSTHKAVNAWRYSTEDGVPSTIVPVRKFGFYNVTVKNFEGEGLSSTGGDNASSRHMDYSEAINCTFSRNEGGSFNMNGSVYVFNCKFFDRAVIEIAVNRDWVNLVPGTVTIQMCDFYNCARGGSGQVISVLNSGATYSLSGRKSTSFICKNNRFNNTKAHVEAVISSPYNFTTVAFYNIGNVDISNNYFRNSGRGRVSGFTSILIRGYNDVVSIHNNVFVVDDGFFTTDYIDQSSTTTSVVSVTDNTYLVETDAVVGAIARGPFGLSDRTYMPKRLITRGNNIFIPSELAFPATFSSIVNIVLPVSRSVTIRAIINVTTSSATNLRLLNAGGGWLGLIYDGTPPVGITVVTVTVTTDNVSTGQYMSNFFIFGNSSTDNTVTLEIDSV